MDPTSTTPTQRLIHRWFVQYNPIYLVSAMLVLGGTLATSRGLVHEGSLYGPLGVALIAEVYAGALIGGAALLTRVGQRRAAVMLALLTVLYQGDLTLHTETCSLLGSTGALASAAWLFLFVAKLYGLAWALRIRLAPRAVATAVVGALGLALGPYVLARVDVGTASAALAVFVFALGSLVPGSSESSVTSREAKGDTTRQVIARSVRATWILWAVLLALHVLFWSLTRPIHLGVLWLVAALFATRRIRRESRLWAALGGTLLGIYVGAPAALSLSAFLVALVLVHRAFLGRVSVAATPASTKQGPSEPSPYRVQERGGYDAPAPTAFELVPVDDGTRGRLLAGALFAAYLGAWTLGWHGGPLPTHVAALDASLLAAALLLAWRMRARLVFAPLAFPGLHALVVSGLVPLPRTLLTWGVTATTLGFALLGVSLAVTLRASRRAIGSHEARVSFRRLRRVRP